jgi:hypothetical protein
MADVLLSTTVTAPVPLTIVDLDGREFSHPVVNLSLLPEFTLDRISRSTDLQAALTAGYITLVNGYGAPITSVALVMEQVLPAAVFGQYYTYAESLELASNSTATYTEKLKLTTPAVVGGTYRAGVSFEISGLSPNKAIAYRVQLDDTTDLLIDEDLVSENLTTIAVGVGDLVLTAGVHTIDIDYRRVDVGGTAYIKNAQLEIWRIA